MSNITYEKVFESITNKLESGIAPWSMPWSGGKLQAAINPFTGTVYSGSNAGLLFCDQISNCRSSHQYATFKQWAQAGKFVRKGESGIPIVFWSKAKDKKDDEKSFIFVKHYTVFNESQLDGYIPLDKPKPIIWDPLSQAWDVIDHSPMASIRIEHDKPQAYYSPVLDYINMPKKELFKSRDGYYATLFHEMGHATGHSSRLDRDLKNHFGSHAYSREELVAELVSAFLCAHSGIQNQVDQSAAYCKSWLKVFKDHPKEMLSAFSQATKATDYILNIKREVRIESEAA